MKRLFELAAMVVVVLLIVGAYHFGIGIHLQANVQAAPLASYAKGPSTKLLPVGGVISTNVVMTLTADGRFPWLMCTNDSEIASGDKVMVRLNERVSLGHYDFIIYDERNAYPTCGGDGAIEIDFVTVLIPSAVITPTEVTTDVSCVVWP